MSDLVRVAPGALIVGKPLPWTVFDAEGQVLLRQGAVIHSESQLEQLFERGLFQPSHEPVTANDETEPVRAAGNPFDDYPKLLTSLQNVFAAINGEDASASRSLFSVAQWIDNLYGEAPDPCLALVHLYSVEPTAHEQTLFYAIIGQAVARELGLDERRRIMLTVASITANIALLPFLDILNRSSRPLTEQQRRIIQKHPILGAHALEKAGIRQSRILKTIRQHHERADGSGYPFGTEGMDILAEAEIVALAERYVAMITRRAYRQRRPFSEARKALRGAMDDFQRPVVPRALLRSLTEYPPGALVRLANGEVAVVTHRGHGYEGAMAGAIIAPRGEIYHEPLSRKTGLLEYNIMRLEVMEQLPSLDYGQLWGFQ